LATLKEDHAKGNVAMGAGSKVFMIALALAVAGKAAQAQFTGDEWRPIEIAKIEVPSNAGLFVRFTGQGKIEGFGGCNRFFGAYTLVTGRIKVGPLGATRMACPEPIMELEGHFVEALQSATRFAREQANLMFYDDAGNLVARLTQNGAD
jgi:putative lipoprotein